MNAKTCLRKWQPLPVAAAVWALSLASASASFLPPLYIGNQAPVRDEYGRPMAGSHLPGGAASRSRIEIRTAPDGIIRPPSVTGVSHPHNPLLSAESIGGIGMNTVASHSGIFGMGVAVRPAAGTRIFARVYNAPTIEQASFYADSELVEVPAGGTDLLLAFGPARPLDDGDDDGDGLINSWEKSLGIDDRHTADYDGDGMSDYDEWLAGTAPDDPNSNLSFSQIRRYDVDAGPVVAAKGDDWVTPVRVRWQSVPGRRYQLQYAETLLDDQAFVDVGEVVTAGEGEFDIDMWIDVGEDPAGIFRVKLVRDGD